MANNIEKNYDNIKNLSLSNPQISENNTTLGNNKEKNFSNNKLSNNKEKNFNKKKLSNNKEKNFNNNTLSNNKEKSFNKNTLSNKKEKNYNNIKNLSLSNSQIIENNNTLANKIEKNFDDMMTKNYNKKNNKEKEEIKNIDIVYLIDSTGSMGNETKNASNLVIKNSQYFKSNYPDIKFQFGIIYYNDPIDIKGDYNEYFQLTENLEEFKNFCDNWKNQNGGDTAEDWAGGYELALNKIKWRNGRKIIYHICDAPAHGRKYSKGAGDNYPGEEYEKKLDTLMERCAFEGIKIVGYYSRDQAKDCFEECKKIYDSKKGKSFEIKEYNKSKIANPI